MFFMRDFKGRHYQGTIILGCVRWYFKYGISYRDLEEMMQERDVNVDYVTLHRWVIKYAPIIEKRLRWHRRLGYGLSWKVDETYVKVKGQWKYQYRAIDRQGHTLDFYLSHTRNARAAKCFLAKALKKLKVWQRPHGIDTDKASSYRIAIKQLKQEGLCSPDLEHRQVKYLNNLIESDHGKLKRLIKPTLGFKSMKTAYATIKGFEVMRMFRKGQMDRWTYDQGLTGEIRLIERQFNF